MTPNSPAWNHQAEIVTMYRDEKKSCREIGVEFGCSRETVRKILLDANVSVSGKGRAGGRPRNLDTEKVRRLYVEDNLPIIEIANKVNAAANTVSNVLKSLGVKILRGGSRQIKYPELWSLKVGESLDLPRIHSATDKRAYVTYYSMAENAGIKVSLKTIDSDTIRVTRKA